MHSHTLHRRQGRRLSVLSTGILAVLPAASSQQPACMCRRSAHTAPLHVIVQVCRPLPAHNATTFRSRADHQRGEAVPACGCAAPRHCQLRLWAAHGAAWAEAAGWGAGDRHLPGRLHHLGAGEQHSQGRRQGRARGDGRSPGCCQLLPLQPAAQAAHRAASLPVYGRLTSPCLAFVGMCQNGAG